MTSQFGKWVYYLILVLTSFCHFTQVPAFLTADGQPIYESNAIAYYGRSCIVLNQLVARELSCLSRASMSLDGGFHLGPVTHDEHIRLCDKILCKVLRYSFAESLSHGHTLRCEKVGIRLLLILQYPTYVHDVAKN